MNLIPIEYSRDFRLTAVLFAAGELFSQLRTNAYQAQREWCWEERESRERWRRIRSSGLYRKASLSLVTGLMRRHI
jgi:hypothetical protein